jgi:glycosyltransferase involved in cell wall biosynthesis
MRPVIRVTLKWASLIVAISPYLSERCKRAGLSGKVWCRPNPVDGRRFHPASPEEKLCLRRRWFPELATGGEVLLLNVGRIRPLKNQLILLDVLMRLPPSCRLVLAGPVSESHKGYLAQIHRRIEELDLKPRVSILIGDHKNPEELMQAADVFLFPSRSEGLGSVVLEALMCGLPVVANPLEGITDSAVDHGKNGFLASFQDIRVVEAIQSASRYSREHRQWIAEEAERRFEAGRIDEQYHDHLMSLQKRSTTTVKHVRGSRAIKVSSSGPSGEDRSSAVAEQ